VRPTIGRVHREALCFRIWEQKGADAAPSGTRRFAYYIKVHDIDELYAELNPKLDSLPKGDVYGSMNQSYVSVSFWYFRWTGTSSPLGKRSLETERPAAEIGRSLLRAGLDTKKFRSKPTCAIA